MSSPERLTHLDATGAAQMVDVGEKEATDRRAVARATVSMAPETAAAAHTTGPTGVEMEAMCACSIAALTVYDMVKGLERGVRVTDLHLVEKTGGRHDWRQR
jgi:molybdenum cofactor biosynthesis enzyme